MLAAYAVRADPTDPLAALAVGQRPDPEAAPGWVRVRLRAAALNQHDLWSLRGVGLRTELLPMVLGCDGAGIDEDGAEVIVHAVIAEPGFQGDETLDPRSSLLSERYDGTLAEYVTVPRRNLVAKPAELSWAEAACLPTAWLTAYRMLFKRSGLAPGDTVLVQGAGGGVATALIMLGSATGHRMWVTSRSAERRARALELGADQAFAPGAKLPERVDAVMDSVGAPTWDHSMKVLKPGGTIVCCGATGGHEPKLDLRRLFFLQLRVIGSTMGTREELEQLVQLCLTTGMRPLIDSELPLAHAREGLAKLHSGEVFGKVVLTCAT